MKKLPLEGIRVANFGWVWAGPVCGQTLSMLGAEVYKIESNSRIDLTRALDLTGTGVAPAWYAPQGSITINLKEPRGKELAKELVAQSDIVIENFGPGVINKMGLGYDVLKEVKEDIIFLSLPTAGNHGPMKDVRTYGVSLASICGFDSITGYEEDGGQPQVFEQAITDPYNGILGAYAAVVALMHKKKTGRGQFIDYSQQQAVSQWMGPAVMDFFMNGVNQKPMGNRTPNTTAAPHSVFRTKGEDQWISIVCQTEDEWQGLKKAMGNPAWADGAAFSTFEKRAKAWKEIEAKLGEWTIGFDKYELSHKLQDCGVAAAPATDIFDLMKDPHFNERQLFKEFEHKPQNVMAPVYGNYVKMSETEQFHGPAPALGESNDHVFKGVLGYSEEDYQKLQDDQIIY